MKRYVYKDNGSAPDGCTQPNHPKWGEYLQMDKGLVYFVNSLGKIECTEYKNVRLKDED